MKPEINAHNLQANSGATKSTNEPTNGQQKDFVGFSDWEKLDLRVAKILKVEEIEGADKLFKLMLDVGSEIGKRTICAGIKEFYKADDLEGRKIILLANLAPRKMRGVESQGMLLAAGSDDENKCVLLSLESDVEVGMRVS